MDGGTDAGVDGGIDCVSGSSANPLGEVILRRRSTWSKPSGGLRSDPGVAISCQPAPGFSAETWVFDVGCANGGN